MYSSMYEIREFIQNLIETTSSVIEFDIYVVDSHLVRVAASGLFKKSIGQALPKGCANDYVIKNGKPLVIDSPNGSDICKTCPISAYGKCFNEYSIYYPIKNDVKCIGAITILSLTPKLKEKQIKMRDKLSIFAKKLGETILIKIKEKETKDRLLTVLNSISEGVVLTDSSGNILIYNSVMKGMLKNEKNIQNIFSENYFEYVMKDAKEYDKEFEVVLKYPIPNNRMFLSVKFINNSNEKIDILFVFKKKKELGNIAYKLLADASHLNINFDSIKGNSKLINEAKSLATKAAGCESNILILGESGTGKEVFARAICKMSRRKNEPFIAINCAAIPENLLESELFGYEKGAFTGANKGGKPGKFELANGGTIFLDEVGDLSLHLQPKLLRVIERGELERVGGVKSIRLDVRIIAATNKDLEEMMKNGEFREDLFYRLCVIPIMIPPLRKRPEDIILLAEYFLGKYNEKFKKNIVSISEEVKKHLLLYNWPGNVRELENVIEYSVNMASTNILMPDCIPAKLNNNLNSNKENNQFSSLKLMRKNSIKELLLKYGNTFLAKQKIAKELGISVSTLYRDIRRYDL
ncbi:MULTISPECIES: sigma-54 interaction domain-containing protein [Clostridium]|uniref:Limonene hydroxylase n=4 Tax=Clostridiaceae TaxID=31979 RepID=D8GIL7_CLOLD|nr:MULTISPECIES: sigma 54-interacting transcriptional regulator [Clostridium]ADK17091.1 predicted transcription regulatory protein [Clostridium ljungdahlii DSM 13528]AGY76129.1 sigma 54-interacting transcriptional regulator [Clostridium autoethanogenum DSM 10061]ALU36291.1 putative sigma54 specific transcriptional regulator [Clostridium autoethanogenum DSM 10061]OAA85143.1 Limonene hydroxylase [Clostridium ljungdahlii DSM 13528]OVY48852.1 Limonene hydroxylase [Clostridium autoethanogenum]